MNDRDRRRYEMLVRVNQFGVENAADFAPGSIGDIQFAAVADEVDNSETKAAEQQGGFGEARQQFEVKGTARENLREEMSDISRTSKSMEHAFDGIAAKFRMPQNATDQSLLATGRAFAADAVPYNANFIAYGLPATFGADLTAACDAFEASFANTAAAIDEHVAATAETAESVRRGMVAVRILDGVVKNKYSNDVGKLAAWLSASHVEKAPKKKAQP